MQKEVGQTKWDGGSILFVLFSANFRYRSARLNLNYLVGLNWPSYKQEKEHQKTTQIYVYLLHEKEAH